MFPSGRVGQTTLCVCVFAVDFFSAQGASQAQDSSRFSNRLIKHGDRRSSSAAPHITKPCVVQLFSEFFSFVNFDVHNYQFQAPISVLARGRRWSSQRTLMSPREGNLTAQPLSNMGFVNLYFGTTPEAETYPLSPSLAR